MRLALVDLLSEAPRCVHELVGALDVPQPLVSQHLKVLRSAGSGGHHPAWPRSGLSARRRPCRPRGQGRGRPCPRGLASAGRGDPQGLSVDPRPARWPAAAAVRRRSRRSAATPPSAGRRLAGPGSWRRSLRRPARRRALPRTSRRLRPGYGIPVARGSSQAAAASYASPCRPAAAMTRRRFLSTCGTVRELVGDKIVKRM